MLYTRLCAAVERASSRSDYNTSTLPPGQERSAGSRLTPGCVGATIERCGKIREAREIEDYLEIGKRHGVHGASIFTWETLQHYLPEVKKAGYLEQFTSGLHPPTAK